MDATIARERIYKNMDMLSIEMDARDNLIQVNKGISIYINKINKSIQRGREVNQKLEVNTRQFKS